jgi:hypothetical protein
VFSKGLGGQGQKESGAIQRVQRGPCADVLVLAIATS